MQNLTSTVHQVQQYFEIVILSRLVNMLNIPVFMTLSTENMVMALATPLPILALMPDILLPRAFLQMPHGTRLQTRKYRVTVLHPYIREKTHN